MLVISRKNQEVIHIGEDIVVKIIKTASGSVKIGIDAPNGLRVLRGELLEEHTVAAPLERRLRSRFCELRDAELAVLSGAI